MTDRAAALLDRLVGSLIATGELMNVYLGDRLGMYAAIADDWRTSAEVADAAGVAERYAREWLEQQAVAGYIEVDDQDADAMDRRFRLPPEHAEVLFDRDAPRYLGAYARVFVAAAQQLPALMQAYREGGGVNWQDYGPDMSEGQEYGNRPTFLNELPGWFAGIPEVHERLAVGGRMADVGSGGGWSSIALALAYPGLTVDGYDLDGPAVERARANAEAAGVADRVRFHLADPSGTERTDGYDLVTAFECIHDMSQPVPVLAAMHAMAGDDGVVIVMDEAVAPAFVAPGDDIERLMYAFSTLVCLPDGMSHEGSVGTGTVMRPATLERYARAAGFAAVEILPIDGGFWRFYRLS